MEQNGTLFRVSSGSQASNRDPESAVSDALSPPPFLETGGAQTGLMAALTDP